MSLKGLGVALATPVTKSFKVDSPALERLVNHVINGGADYLVVLGTTGESPVFSWEEKLQILEKVIDLSNMRVPTVFGHGGNNTYELIRKSRDLQDLPIAALLSVSPYYNKPSQNGIIRHYELLAESSEYPIILYNVPARTGSNVEAETTLALSAHENIIGMKEASGDIEQVQKILREKRDEFLLLSGDDAATFDMIKAGADGVISVVGNIFPKPFKKMLKTIATDVLAAEKLDKDLQHVYQLLSKEGNPVSLKTGLECLGICERTVVPPLFDGSEALASSWQLAIEQIEQ
ncbi:MAG: 4-hydroxy-tetrahydrodipicolinate synthase [Bacteroidota bacterium]